MSSTVIVAQSINNTAMLVFLMQAGFTMLEAGSVRERNVSRCRALRTLVFLPSTQRSRSLAIHAHIPRSPIPLHRARLFLFLCR